MGTISTDGQHVHTQKLFWVAQVKAANAYSMFLIQKIRKFFEESRVTSKRKCFSMDGSGGSFLHTQNCSCKQTAYLNIIIWLTLILSSHNGESDPNKATKRTKRILKWRNAKVKDVDYHANKSLNSPNYLCLYLTGTGRDLSTVDSGSRGSRRNWIWTSQTGWTYLTFFVNFLIDFSKHFIFAIN